MYHIIYDETIASLRNNAPQKIRIVVNTANESFEITQSNLTQGSCSVDRYCCVGEKIEIGSASAAELKLTLKNAVIKHNGQEYNPENITFEGAEMRPFCLVPSVDGRYEEIPLGVFTVDEPPRKLSTITIKALDHMMRFDVPHDGTVGTSLLVVVQHCCNLAGVTLSSSAVTFLNSFAGVYTLPEAIADKEDLTCRQVLMWVGEMTASCAYADENGQLAFKQYPKSYTGAMTISEADRYSSDMQESDIVITGITVTPAEGDAVTIGAQGYEFNVESNPLIVDPAEMAAAPLGYSNGAFFSYRPFTANTKSFPHLWPMDAIVFYKRNSKGESIAYNSVITHHTWKLNGGSAISAVGKTATKNGYATHGGFTAKQKAVLERAVKGQVKARISGYQQAILDINEVAQRASGLYKTSVKQEDGTVIDYYHNQPLIENSTYIYTENSEGYFVSDHWDGENTVWTQAWTAAGLLVTSSIAAGSITTDMLNIGGAANPVYNLMTASDFYDASGGSGWKKDGFQSAAYDISSEAGFEPPVGRDMMRLHVGTATNTYCFVRNLYQINVEAEKKYTASFYSRRDSSNDSRYSRLVVKWYDSNGNELTQGVIAVNKYSSTQWNRFSGVITAPKNCTKAEICFYVDNTNSYDDSCIYIAGFMFEEGSTPHDWDDGEHPTSSNVIIDRTGIDVYNGAFNLYAPNGQNVVHFDADGSLNIDSMGKLEVVLTADSQSYKSTGKSHITIKLPTSSKSIDLTSLDANKMVYVFNEAVPYVFMDATDIVGDEEGSVSPSKVYFNPYGIHIEDPTVSSGYFCELQGGRLYFKNGSAYSRLNAGTLNLSGTVFSKSTAVSSSETIKTNITEAESMLDKIINAGIYSYNYISDTESDSSGSGDIIENGGGIELGPAPTHYGLVIGEGYNTPAEVISEDGTHIDLYSMISLAWKAIQELAGKINNLTTTEVT